MLGSGHGAHVAAGHAGQARGSGHLTIGQRGRGHGGHSPILHGFEHVEIHGGHLGTEDLSTYFDISGSGGHSVLSMYLDISGMGAQGGTVAFKTHLLGSGSAQGGHPPATAGHAQGRWRVQTLQTLPSANPSVRRRRPMYIPTTNAITTLVMNTRVFTFTVKTILLWGGILYFDRRVLTSLWL